MTEAPIRMPQFTQNWFDGNIPSLQRWLGKFSGRPGLRALEIGSFEGRSTLWLCENILTTEDARIDCLDLFATDPVHGDYLSRFRHNTSEHTWKVREVHGPSFEGLRQVEGPYDIVYVDGWHSAFGALADGVMSWPMLKVGGVMVFDDYLWVPPKYGEPPVPNALARFWATLRGRNAVHEAMERHIAACATECPKRGVDGLLATLEGHYEVVGVDRQIAVRKTREFGHAQVGLDT